MIYQERSFILDDDEETLWGTGRGEGPLEFLVNDALHRSALKLRNDNWYRGTRFFLLISWHSYLSVYLRFLFSFFLPFYFFHFPLSFFVSLPRPRAPIIRRTRGFTIFVFRKCGPLNRSNFACQYSWKHFRVAENLFSRDTRNHPRAHTRKQTNKQTNKRTNNQTDRQTDKTNKRVKRMYDRM